MSEPNSPKSPRRHRTSIARTSKIIEDPIPEDSNVPAEFPFDITAVYRKYLSDEDIPMPVAAIMALTEMIASTRAETMYELVEALKTAAATLKRATPNPISLTAGCDLFIRYVTTARQEYSSFHDHKDSLVREGHLYASNLASSAREKIAKHSISFIPDEAVILTHSYSRVVIQALLHAYKRKRISVYVTEARPRGLGVKAYETLTAAGVPTTLILDSAVGYIMDKVDLVLVGSEAVVESGGLINAVGSYQTAIIAKAAGKPLYALAESYKFLRSFPLSQYDLPMQNTEILPVPSQRASTISHNTSYRVTPSTPGVGSPTPSHSNASALPPTPGRTMSRSFSTGYFTPVVMPTLCMTPEQLAENPEVDYTRPDLITLVFTDVGILTPPGVSQYLVGIFAD